MNQNHQLLCARSAYLMVALFIIACVPFANFVPPIDPALEAFEVVEIYRANTGNILIGMVLLLTAVTLYMPLYSIISLQMARIEGDKPILAIMQGLTGVCTCMIAMVSIMFFAVAAFRVDQLDPNIVWVLNDLGFMTLLWPFAPAFFQSIAIGLCIISDKSSTPVYPRWIGYYNFWVALVYLPGALIPFFKSGPFSWIGIMAFWIPAIDFFIFIFIMTFFTVKAIKQQSLGSSAAYS